MINCNSYSNGTCLKFATECVLESDLICGCADINLMDEGGKPQTNYDLIVNKTPYDLADWIAQILMYHGSFSRRPLTIDDNECPHECPLYKCCNDQPSDNIEDWLKAPADKEETE